MDCETRYLADKKRRRFFLPIGIITILVVIVFGIALIVTASRTKVSLRSQWNKTKFLSEKPAPLINEAFDQNA